MSKQDATRGMPVVAGVEIAMDEVGRYNLNALHRASGLVAHKKPSQWLRRDEAKSLIAAIENQGVDLHLAPVDVIHGGISPGTFATEQLAVAYANWISPEFYLQVIDTFIAYRKGELQPAQPMPFLPDGLQLMPTRAFSDNNLTKRNLRVLAAMCALDPELLGQVAIHRRALASWVGMPETTISTELTHLEEKGWIRRMGNNRNPAYAVNWGVAALHSPEVRAAIQQEAAQLEPPPPPEPPSRDDLEPVDFSKLLGLSQTEQEADQAPAYIPEERAVEALLYGMEARRMLHDVPEEDRPALLAFVQARTGVDLSMLAV